MDRAGDFVLMCGLAGHGVGFVLMWDDVTVEILEKVRTLGPSKVSFIIQKPQELDEEQKWREALSRCLGDVKLLRMQVTDDSARLSVVESRMRS